jgi:hypothetical protein
MTKRDSAQDQRDLYLGIALGARRRGSEGHKNSKAGEMAIPPEFDAAFDKVLKMSPARRELMQKYMEDDAELARKEGLA